MNTSFPRIRNSVPMLAATSLALMLALGGCGRNTGKAIALEGQGDALVAAGDTVRAADTFWKANQYDGNDPGRWLKLGRARRDLDQPVQAVEAFQQAVDLDPANIEAMQNLVVLYVGGRQYEAAEQLAGPLLALSPDDIAGLLGTGAIAYYRQRYPEADRIADRLIALSPDSKEGYLLKAHVLQKTGHAAAGARMLEARLKLTPDDADLAAQLLELYQTSGSVAGVRSTAIVLARLKPDDPRYQLESLRAFQARGDTAERERVTAYLLDRYRANPSILGAVADFWVAALPQADAAARIQALATRSGGGVKAALAARLIAIGAYDRAGAVLAGVAAQPVAADTADLHATAASLDVARGQVAAAHRQADAVLAVDGGNDLALIVRARAFLAEKAYDKALVDAQLVVADDPANEAASLLIPRIYAAQGNDALAAQAYGDAQSRSPRSIGVVRARVAWLVASGRAGEAAQIAGLFARAQNRGDAWALYEETCRTAKDPICLAQARGRGIA